MPEETPNKQWEPPPWEAEAFDALKKRREEEAAEQAAAAQRAAEQAAEQAAALAAAGLALEESSAAPVPAETPAPAGPVASTGEKAPAEAEPRKPAVADARVEAMLLSLRAEEPAAVGQTWTIAAIVALFLILLGIALLAWGGIWIARAQGGPALLTGGAIIIVFGGMSIGLAAWLVQRTLKTRGVR